MEGGRTGSEERNPAGARLARVGNRVDRGPLAAGQRQNRALFRHLAGPAGEGTAHRIGGDDRRGESISGRDISSRLERALRGGAGKRGGWTPRDRRDALSGERSESCGATAGEQRLHRGVGGSVLADPETCAWAGAAPIEDPGEGATGRHDAGAHRWPFRGANTLREAYPSHGKDEAQGEATRASAWRKPVDEAFQ